MGSTIVVAEITRVWPNGLEEHYEASRIFYPQHPCNAIEFDDAKTGIRTMIFGPALVKHLSPDAGPKSPTFTSMAYYGFWLFWLAVLIFGAWWVTRP